LVKVMVNEGPAFYDGFWDFLAQVTGGVLFERK
jgi:hypothetical protein